MIELVSETTFKSLNSKCLTQPYAKLSKPLKLIPI